MATTTDQRSRVKPNRFDRARRVLCAILATGGSAPDYVGTCVLCGALATTPNLAGRDGRPDRALVLYHVVPFSECMHYGQDVTRVACEGCNARAEVEGVVGPDDDRWRALPDHLTASGPHVRALLRTERS